jgi:hypothetical protein
MSKDSTVSSAPDHDITEVQPYCYQFFFPGESDMDSSGITVREIIRLIDASVFGAANENRVVTGTSSVQRYVPNTITFSAATDTPPPLMI